MLTSPHGQSKEAIKEIFFDKRHEILLSLEVTNVHISERLTKIIKKKEDGGTGMMCLGFKGSSGISSRVVKIKDSTYTVGVLVQSNFGGKKNFTIVGAYATKIA